MEQFLNNFGERLRLARNNKNISQRELSEKIGAAKGSIPAYENGLTDPRMSVVKQIADALGVHVEWLITGNNVIDLGTDNVRATKIKEYIRFLDSQKTEEA